MKKRVLVTVLTYPCPSKTYIETVCTAGITEEGEWIRIYPLKLRLLENGGRLHKYNWYDFDVEPRTATSGEDPRRESYHCLSQPDCKSLDKIGTENNWSERKKICIDKVGCYTNYEILLKDANRRNPEFISLATFKPSKIIDFVCEKRDVEKEEAKKEEILAEVKNQFSLFDSEEIPNYWKMSKSIPYYFRYVFQDDEGREEKLNVEDWEVGRLYLRYIEQGASEELAKKKVREQYFDNFKNKDLYFFMGTRNLDHKRNYPNPFSIIGVFYPPKEKQPSLF